MQPRTQKKTFGRRKELPRIAFSWRGKTRTFTIRPWLSGSTLAIFVLFMSCYFAATAYLVYRDDILDSALARQVELQYAYEERIALLRSEIDRVTSRHLVESQSLEEQLQILLEQQDLLARRQALLDSLIAKARAEGISSAAAAMPMPLPRPARGERWSGAAADTRGRSPLRRAKTGASRRSPARWCSPVGRAPRRRRATTWPCGRCCAGCARRSRMPSSVRTRPSTCLPWRRGRRSTGCRA